MQPRHLKSLLSASLLEGVIALGYFLSRPSDAENARLFGFSFLRLGLAAAFTLVLFLLLVALVNLLRGARFPGGLLTPLDKWIESEGAVGKHLFTLQGALLVLLLAVFEAFLLTFFVIPIPARSFLLWSLVVIFQAWLLIRVVYTSHYRERPSALTRLRLAWQGWTPTQKHIFFALIGIGLVHFLAFIPANLGGLHVDEQVIYPDVVTMLMPGATFKETLQHLIVNESWWYGYPYMAVSAVVLLIPRLVFGLDFGAHMTLNLLLLRQFVSILPLIISIGLLVYLLTRFKSWLKSLGLFIFLLLVPGAVMFGYRFWHPDSLVLLTVVLTIFFLQRDRGRFGRDFYLAAFTCGLAVAIKFWGFFFVLTIAFILLKGLREKALTPRRMLFAGLAFVLVMVLTVALSSPSAFIPWSFDMLVHGLQYENTVQLHGYNESDPGGAYRTGLGPWLEYIDIYYMKPWFFFFAFAALLLGSFLGSQKDLSRLLLTWCLVVAFYFIAFMAVKRFHYMMQLTIPLYASAFLFPSIAGGGGGTRLASLMGKPWVKTALWSVTIALFGIQFVYNLVTVFTSPWIGVFVKP